MSSVLGPKRRALDGSECRYFLDLCICHRFRDTRVLMGCIALQALFAGANILVFCFMLPIWYYRMVMAARRDREKCLKTTRAHITQIFQHFDDDSSGELETNELRPLLKELGFAEQVMEKTLKDIDKSGDGKVDHDEFQAWYAYYLRYMFDSPLDILYITTKTKAPWWFLEVL